MTKKTRAVHPQQPVVQSVTDTDLRKTLSVQSVQPDGYWEIEVLRGSEWIRLAGRYGTRECARSWLPFTKKAWRARFGRTVFVKKKIQRPDGQDIARTD